MKKDNFWTKLPWYIQLPIIGGAGYLIYKGVTKLINRPPVIPLPTGGQGIPVVSYDPQGNPTTWSPRPLSQELYDSMSGLDWTSSKEEAWGKLLNLPTNDMVVSVYNDFNQQFGGGETLTQWIDDEYGSFFTSNKPGVLQRLRGLGLN
jgi:hypothetical protein